MQRKGSISAIIYCIRKPGENRHESQTPLSPQTEMDDRAARPVVSAQHTDQFIIENDETNSYAEAESELSLKSRSFLHRVKDQVRKRQNQSSKDATRQRQTFCNMVNVYVFNIDSICIHVKELPYKIGIPSKIRKISQ